MNNTTISMAVETITPEIAKAMLTMNTYNRKPSMRHITSLARAMKNGDWKVNGDAVRIGDGILIDGQHRLLACVKAGVPFESIVVRGLDSAVFDTVDTGKLRSAGDVFQIKKEKYPTLLASAIRVYVAVTNGWTLSTVRLSNVEMERFLDENQDIRNHVRYFGANYEKLRGFFFPASVAAMSYLFSHRYPDEAKEFFDAIISGVNLKEGNPAHTLREFLIRHSFGPLKVNKQYINAVTIKAFKNYVTGVKMMRVQYRETEDFPSVHEFMK